MGHVKCVRRDTFEETLCSECPANTGFFNSCLEYMRKHYTYIIDDQGNIVQTMGAPNYGKLSDMIAKRGVNSGR